MTSFVIVFVGWNSRESLVNPWIVVGEATFILIARLMCRQRYINARLLHRFRMKIANSEVHRDLEMGLFEAVRAKNGSEFGWESKCSVIWLHSRACFFFANTGKRSTREKYSGMCSNHTYPRWQTRENGDVWIVFAFKSTFDTEAPRNMMNFDHLC